MAGNCKDEMIRKVMFQGERGCYSEEAAIGAFGKVEMIPCRTLSEVFMAVEAGKGEGIVPVENSIEGSVVRTLDLLKDSDVQTSGEVILRISHCLIVNPGAELKSIKRVYSHPQALGQCERYLNKLGCEAMPTYDTAGSLQLIKRERGTAAIASARAAKIYGMEVLERDIQTSPENYTKFFIISAQDAEPTGHDKTSIVFTTKHLPGYLYRCLAIFAREGLNLTKIESRPILGQPWNYNFYLDFEGHRTDERSKRVLKELKEMTIFLKVLGSYPKAMGDNK